MGLNGGTLGAGESELSGAAEIEIIEHVVVETADATDATFVEHCNLGGTFRGLSSKPQGTGGRPRPVSVFVGHDWRRGLCPRGEHEDGHAAIVGCVEHKVPIGRVLPAARRPIPVGRQYRLVPGGALMADQLDLGCVVVPLALHPVGEKAAVGAVPGAGLLRRQAIGRYQLGW